MAPEDTYLLSGTTANGTSGTAGTGALAGDSDPSGGTLSIASVAHNGVSQTVATGSTAAANPTTVTGTYGTLNIGSDGSYSYAATNGLAIVIAPDGQPIRDAFTDTVASTSGGTANSSLTAEVLLAQGGAEMVTNPGGAATYSIGATTLTLATTQASTFAGVIQDGSSGNTGGSVVITGTGPLTLMGANYYTGATTVSTGILNIQNGNALGTTAGGTTVASGATLQLQGNITVGAEALTLAGRGFGFSSALENVSGTNTYGGTITLTGISGIQSDAGSSLTLNATNAVTGNSTLTVTGAGNTVIAGTITTGAGKLLKAGSGTLTLSGSNTYTGGTEIDTGTLAVSADNNLGAASGALALGAGKLEATASFESARGISLQSASLIQVDGGNNTLTLSGVVSDGAGGGRLVLVGDGNLTLSGVNNYTRETSINTGNSTLALSGAGSIASSSKILVYGTFDISGSTTVDVNNNALTAITSLTGGVGTVLLGDRTLTITNAADTFSGHINGTGGITLAAGTETLSNTNGYQGVTTVTGGTLALSGAGSIASSSGVVADGTFDISAVNAPGGAVITTLSGSATGTLALGTQTLTLTAAAGTFAGALTGTTGTLTLAAGAEVFSGHSTAFTGGVAFNAGTISLTQRDALDRAVVTFGTGAQTLNLDAVGTYTNTLTGFAVEDTIDLRGLASTGASASYDAVTHNLTVSSGGQTDILHFATGYALPSGYQFNVSDDGAGHAKITLGLIPPPPPAPSGPTAAPDTDSTVIGTAVTKAAAMGVLANDSGSGGTLSVTAVNGQTAAVGKALAGAYGNLTLNADGSYAYAPDPAKAVFTGSVVDHFTYTDTANGQTATTTLDITVAPPAASVLALFGTVVTNAATQTGSVYALYEGLLGRAPDALGLENFSASIQAGSYLTSVAQAILGSPEHGPAIADPNAYVQSLYTNVLHRSADGGGLIYFTNELNAGVSQATVAVQIATSQEAQDVNASAFSTGVFVPDAIDSAVAREYYAVLGRTPDATGLQSFEFQVKQAAGSGGANGAIQAMGNVANAMLTSPEYAQSHGGLTDAGFIDSLYVGALGRHAEAGGAAFYADQLAHGISKATVALEISQSAEAQVHLVGQIENGFHLIG
ncbi:DUF4214 domain-containing protein [Methylobacterium sp. E-016]|nr:DUF4214 domain-containing protein [Methylobacterium sp. E-016]